MKILVCVKRVPEFDPDAEIELDEHGRIVFSHLTAFRMNRVDENAVEEALLIKKQHPGVSIDALTVGPDDSDVVVRRAMGMGANMGIHIRTGGNQRPAAVQTAEWIAEVIRNRGYDLILTGIMSEDQMQGQVGPMLAEILGMPCATSVIAEEIDLENRHIIVQREIEGGYRDILELKLPAVLTIQSGINTPRYPVLSHVMRAKRTQLEVIQADTLTTVPFTAHSTLIYPEKTRAALVLGGSAKEKADRLFSILQEKAIIP